MEYKRFNNKIVIRIDAGDEICESVKAVAVTEGIGAASVAGIGGGDRFVLGVWDMAKKGYVQHEFTGTYEITSIVGNIARLNGEPLVHLHLTAAGEGAKLIGGHLLAGYISLTSEIFVDIIDGTIDKSINDELGIKEMKFI